ncbi:MAG TPA: DUF5996 family protein [Candidatus Saccharimonadales bacterium]|jgi:hypothetical protein|nr:DUF5996 family protein [Candidatus Saccharimonadales bacterium]
MDLPDLELDKLGPTRDYLHDAAKILGKLQQAFLPKSPRDWHYGLEVTLRGISTQQFELNGQPTKALIDLVQHKLRLGDQNWRLRENPPAQLFTEVGKWLTAQGIDTPVEEPQFSDGVAEFDHEQADAYAAALWWIDQQFRQLRGDLTDGVTAPILLYPHHFDLSLVLFPWDDERQVAVGWSTGDETIPEPYIYLTAYPEPPDFKKTELPAEAQWQSEGFSGAVLLYNELAKADNPAELFRHFTEPIFSTFRTTPKK